MQRIQGTPAIKTRIKTISNILIAVTLLYPLAIHAAARTVQPSGRGPQRLEVDAELIVHSTDGTLGELRLHDSKQRQVHGLPHFDW